MVVDDMQDSREERTVYPPRVLREWLDRTSPADLYERLKRRVWGQDEELKKAAIMVYGFITAMASNAFDIKFHFLIEGSSGCGKSTFAYALQEILPCPVIVGDGSSITPAGYKGADVGDLLNAQELVDFWGCGILVIDELDKVMQPTHSSEGNFHMESLHTMLKLLDGGTVVQRSGDSFPCDKIMVIGMGAFTPLRRPETPEVKRSIGFGSDRLSEAVRGSQRPVERLIAKEEMTAFCGSEQFLGRFLTILHFKKLGKEVFSKIVWQTEAEIREIYGCGFSISREERIRLIETAMTTDFGARGIKSSIWEIFLSAPDDWIMQRPAAYPQVDLDAFYEERMEAIMTT